MLWASCSRWKLKSSKDKLDKPLRLDLRFSLAPQNSHLPSYSSSAGFSHSFLLCCRARAPANPSPSCDARLSSCF